MSRRALLTVGIVLALGVTAVPAFAGKPSRPGGGTTTASITPSCNPCAAGTSIRFSGSGYNASQGVAKLDMNGGWTATGVTSEGTVAFDWPYFTQPATYTVKVYQYGNGGKLVLKAQTTVTVQ